MSMLKTTASWADLFDEPSAQIVQLSSRGLQGSDYRSFVKRASTNLLDDLDNLREKVASDEALVHLLAIGATEDYGCFVAGTGVRTSAGQLVSIDQLQLAESVMDRNGAPGKITTLYTKQYDGPGVNLTINGIVDPLTCTANHKFFVIPASQVACLIDQSKHCKPGTCQVNSICSSRNCSRTFPKYEVQERQAGQLNVGDYMLCPVPDRGIGTQTWAWSDAMAAVFGYWLAEGSFVKNKNTKTRTGLQFCFGLHEAETVCKDFEDACRELCDEYAGLRLLGPWHNEEDGTVSYNIVGNDKLVLRVYRAGHEYSQTKKLGGTVYSQTPQRIARMLGAYIDGDGTCPRHIRRDSSYTEARYSATTASKRLALDIQFLLTRLGVAACVQKVQIDDVRTGEPREHYRVSFTNVAGEWLNGVCRKHTAVPPLQYKEHSFLWNGFICRPIRRVEHFQLQSQVFNLEVMDDHSYTVGNGIACRNCNRNGDGFRRGPCQQYHPTFEKYARFYRDHKNKDPRKSYGRIVKSAWNDKMKRIELLVAWNAEESAAKRNGGLVADKEMEKLAAGKELGVSMACKVPYDSCSYCGNRAETTEEYCTGTHQGGMCKAGGLRDNIGSLVEVDGGIHQLHADNDRPCFIDISHVSRNADRIAFVTGALEKRASNVLKSADLARQFGVVLPYDLMIAGEQSPKVQQMAKLAYALAQIEADLVGAPIPESALAFKSTVQGDTPLNVPAGGREKGAGLLRALADQKICLPLSRFIELAADYSFEKAADAAAIVSRELPGIYTQLLADADLPKRLQNNQYVPATTEAPLAFSTWAVKHAEAMSLQSQHVNRRVTRASLYLETPEFSPVLLREKTAASRDNARRLAEEYAMYKLAFLSSLSTNDPQLPLTCLLAVVQNYAR